MTGPASVYAPYSACGAGCLPKLGTTPQVPWPVCLLRLTALVLALLLGVLVGAVVPFAAARPRAWLIRTWFRTLVRAAGVRLVVRGGDRLSAAGAGTLVTANHVSWLDIPALMAIESLTMVAKSDVRDWPVIGMLAARGGTVFIDRRGIKGLPATVAQLGAALRGGTSVMVFPEGTTWCGRLHGRFRRAAFQAAIDAGAPVRALAIRYVLGEGTPTTAPAFLGDEALLPSILRVIAVRGLVVEVEIGALLPSTGTDRRALAARTAAVIRDAALARRDAPMLSSDDTDCLHYGRLREPDVAGHRGGRG